MKIFRRASALLLFPSVSMLFAQTPVTGKEPAAAASAEPILVDVHPSPYRSAISYRNEYRPTAI